ncbi:MAG: filamentous hemagglutinin N-terminal domain-containing protein [Gammaproteobacteria bacterium]|nr:filamentous hemagglutinin N-terminal domain-containing protein [Gammaproteobacteria bacterium]
MSDDDMNKKPAKRIDLGRTISSLLRKPASVALLGIPGIALAGPEGGEVVHGNAFITNPNTTTTHIDQLTDRAIINWDSFNVGADEYVIFDQLSASSIVLNRVLGGDASYILGQIQANGQVFLVNPQGVFFAEGASIDVQGLLATTLDISDQDFIAGDYSFNRVLADTSTGQVINDGTITAGNGGYVLLAGDFTENNGVVTAMAGTVGLVSGNDLTVDLEGDGLVNFSVSESTLADASGVRNAGSLLADGGMVVMTARVANDLVATAVNNEGLVRANAIENVGGEIWLVGHGGDVENAGTLDASGVDGDGGQMMVRSNQDVILADGGVQTVDGDAGFDAGDARFIAEEQLDQLAGNTISAQGATGGTIEVSGYGGVALAGMQHIAAGGALIMDPQHIAMGTGAAAPAYTASSYTWNFTPLFYQNSEDVTRVTTGWITGQLNLGVDVTLVASETITWDNAIGGVTLGATGSGDLSLYIGDVATGGTTSFGLGLAGGVFGGSGVTVNPSSDPDASHQISLSNGLNDINVAGNFTASIVGGGTDAAISLPGIGTSAARAASVTINAGSGSVVFGSLDSINVDTTVDITGGNIQNAYVYTALTGVTYNGDIVGTNFYAGTSGAITNVRGLTVNGNVNVSNAVWLNVGSGAININGSVNATIGNMSITADGSSSGPGTIDITGLVSGGGNIIITASGPGATGTGGSINVLDVTAGGNLTVSATAGIGGGGIITAGPLNASGVSVTGSSITGTSFIVGNNSPAGLTAINAPINVAGSVSIAGSAGGNVAFGAGATIDAGSNVTIGGQFIQGVNINTANLVTINGDLTGVNADIGSSVTSSNVQDVAINGNVQLSGTANIHVAPAGSIVITGTNNSASAGLVLAAGINQTSPTGLVSFGGGFFSSGLILHAGQVNVNGVVRTPGTITITGNGTIGGSLVQFGTSASRVNAFNYNGNINASGAVTIYTGGFGNGINVTGSVAGQSILLDAQANGSGGGDITVGGAISASGGPVTISAEHITGTADAGGNVTVGGGINALGAINVSATDLAGFNPSTADIEIGGTIIGSSVTITTNAVSSLGGRIDLGVGTPEASFLAANISAATGDVTLTAVNGAGVINAGNITANNGAVVISNNTGQGHVHLGNYTGSVLTGPATVTASTGVTIGISGSDALLDAGNINTGGVANISVTATGNNAAGNMTLGSVNGGDIVLQASNTFAGGEGVITLLGNVNASSGSFLANAGGASTGSININGNITALGDVNFGASPARLFFGGGSYTITATTGDIIANANIFNTAGNLVDYVAGNNVTLSGFEIFTGNITAGNSVNINGSGATNQSFGDITANHINAAFAPSGAGSINVTMGNLTANGTAPANRDVVINVNGFGGSSLANVNIGNVSAVNGDVSLQVFSGGGSGTTAPLTVGNISAGRFAAVYTPGNLVTGAITVDNASSTGLVTLATNGGGGGNITVDGNISVTGRGGGTTIVGAALEFQTIFSNSDAITVNGDVSLNGIAGNVTGATNSIEGGTESYTGNLGAARLRAETQNGTITMGNITVNAAGFGDVQLNAAGLTVGDVTANVAAASFVRTSTVITSSYSSAATETVTSGGAFRLQANDLGLAPGSLAMGNLSIVAPQVQIELFDFASVTGGNVDVEAFADVGTVTATGSDFIAGSAFGYNDTRNGGGARMAVGDASGNGTINFGSISITGQAFANLQFLADNITVQDINNTATGGTFTRSGTGNPYASDGPFNPNNGEVDGGPSITSGTLNGGVAEVRMVNFNGSLGIDTDASNIDLGNVSVSALGSARVELFGTTINTLNMNVSATAGMRSGDIDRSSIDSLSNTINTTGTVTGSYGEANVAIRALTTPGAVSIGDLTLTGPITGGNISGTSLTVGNIGIAASGVDIAVTEVMNNVTLGTSSTFSLVGPGLIAGMGFSASNALVVGDVNISGIGGAGAMLTGNTVQTGSINIDVANGSYDVQSAAFFGGSPSSFVVGNALLGIDAAAGPATVNGSITINAAGGAHVGGSFDVSGDVAITAGGSYTLVIPESMQFLNSVRGDGSPLVLPSPLYMAANNIQITAGTGLGLNNATLLAAGNMNIAAGNRLAINGVDFQAGGSMTLDAGGAVNGATTPGSLVADALAITAGGNINLPGFAITVGSGAIAGESGDALLVSLLAGDALAPTSTTPNAYFSGNNVILGDLVLSGSYLLIKSNTLSLASFSGSDPDTLVQLTSRSTASSIGLENTAAATSTVNYSNADHLSLFAGLTVALGSTNNTGDILAGQNGTIDVGSTNVFLLTNGTVTGLDKIITTGIVKDLQTLLSGGFETPQTDEIDVSQNTAGELADLYGTDSSEGEEEGDEEGEDTDDETGIEEEDDSLIRQDTMDEELTCS